MEHRGGFLKCPKCAEALALIIEPEVLEFYCPNDHTFDLESLILSEASTARQLLREATVFWLAQEEELLREAEFTRMNAPALLASFESRARVAAERVRTLQRAMEKCG